MIYNFTVPNIHCSNFFHIIMGKRKIKHIEILHDSLLVDRFWNNHDTALNIPAKSHLCSRLAVLISNIRQDRIGKKIM